LAFSLIELLVVIAIIGLLAAIGLPALRGFGRGNAMNAAERQLLDDLSLARLRAISERTTVYMVFVPPVTNISDWIRGRTDRAQLQQLTNLYSGQFTTYALVAARSVGDQPGRPRPRYLTDWRRLPEGVMIRPAQVSQGRYHYLPTFDNAGNPLGGFDFVNTNNSPVEVPFPSAEARGQPPVVLPCVAFNSSGQLASAPDRNLILTPGSVFVTKRNGRVSSPDYSFRDLRGGTTPQRGDQPDSVVEVNWLTGRGSVRPVLLR
jgi:prepilin-type N-terminal cleavage/methylation domain-containing protein